MEKKKKTRKQGKKGEEKMKRRKKNAKSSLILLQCMRTATMTLYYIALLCRRWVPQSLYLSCGWGKKKKKIQEKG